MGYPPYPPYPFFHPFFGHHMVREPAPKETPPDGPVPPSMRPVLKALYAKPRSLERYEVTFTVETREPVHACPSKKKLLSSDFPGGIAVVQYLEQNKATGWCGATVTGTWQGHTASQDFAVLSCPSVSVFLESSIGVAYSDIGQKPLSAIDIFQGLCDALRTQARVSTQRAADTLAVLALSPDDARLRTKKYGVLTWNADCRSCGYDLRDYVRGIPYTTATVDYVPGFPAAYVCKSCGKEPFCE